MVGRNSALELVLLEEAQDHRTRDAAVTGGDLFLVFA